ncbi:hypothetical protein Daesc_000731 [Daldinia eschscholtzii]|uniref:DUF7709 domain-containing protein n=1 Tax=Daldinia eschscholtzii TaxID=292717 RepID=A0AAX6N0I1_9PEZI
MADNVSVDRESKLAALNSATLGAEMPQITLPDGSKVQTGTMGVGDKDKQAQLEDSMRATLPLLDKVGMFELFPPEDWISGNNEGRKVVGRMYQEFKSQK